MRGRAPAVLLALTLAATAVVYGPIVSAYFVADDFLNLFAVVDANLGEYLLRSHGGHLLLVRNAVFAASYHLFGMRAELYFWVVLLTHLLNTALLFRIVVNWTDSAALGAFGALLWAVSPCQAGTLAWYSVYGQVLVATVLLVILHQLSAADRDRAELPATVLVTWPLLLIIAATCFGVGIGLLMLSPLAVYLLLPRSRVRLGLCVILALIAALTPTAYRALIVYHDQLVGSADRAGAMAMAIAFAGLSYHAAIAWMLASLLSCGISNLLLGFGAPAVGFPSTPATVATAAYGLVVIVALWRAPARIRLRLLGLLAFAVAAYGIIAAGRAVALPGAEVVALSAEPRYHYVGMIPLGIALCCAIAQLTAPSRFARHWHYGLLIAAAVAASVLYARSTPFIDLHPAARRETYGVVAQIRSAIAHAPPGGEVLIRNHPFASIGLLLRGYRAGFPGWAGIFTLFFADNVVDGKRVRFVVSDPTLIDAIAVGKRSRDLFVVVPTAPAPPAGGQNPRP